MPDKKVHLKAVMMEREGKRAWTGSYACSICDLRFQPDPNDPARLLRDFLKHKDQHSDATGN